MVHSTFFSIQDALQLQPFRPSFQLRFIQTAIEHPAIHDLGTRGAGAQPSGRLAQTAAAGGGEENDGFSGEVIGLQEGIKDGGGTYHHTGNPRKITSCPATGALVSARAGREWASFISTLERELLSIQFRSARV